MIVGTPHGTLLGAGQDPSRGAVLSPCRRWRYRLWRRWGSGQPAAFIGLNPSTADETEDDPTIRRCVGYARAWGLDGLEMLNLYGWRSTDPGALWMPSIAALAVGPDNDAHILETAREAAVVVAAWGAFPKAQERGLTVVRMLRQDRISVHVLRWTKHGAPAHPLYLPAWCQPVPWDGTDGRLVTP